MMTADFERFVVEPKSGGPLRGTTFAGDSRYPPPRANLGHRPEELVAHSAATASSAPMLNCAMRRHNA